MKIKLFSLAFLIPTTSLFSLNPVFAMEEEIGQGTASGKSHMTSRQKQQKLLELKRKIKQSQPIEKPQLSEEEREILERKISYMPTWKALQLEDKNQLIEEGLKRPLTGEEEKFIRDTDEEWERKVDIGLKDYIQDLNH